jgi:hypothetical protein
MRPEVGATRGAASTRPVIKAPVWKPEIPLYFYTGGLAGASAGMGLLAEMRGERAFSQRAWALAFAGSVASPVLLISDLGVPSRFLHMLRMFKVTSPMSLGSWVLAGFGVATAPATVAAFLPLGRPGRAAQATSAALGLPLSAYTAALIANTAVPAWHEARHELPFLFCAGAAASSGAALTALSPVGEAQAARRLAVGGAIAELALAQAMERRLTSPVYQQGAARRLRRGATTLTAAGAAVIAARGARSRRAAIAGGLLVTAGAIAERWTVFRAGSQSALRPEDTVAPQRARVDRDQNRGASRDSARVPAVHAADGNRPGERPVPRGSPAIGS